MLLLENFVKIHPVPFQREIIIDFDTMKSEMITIDLGPFAINKYPVTNEEFHRFIQETGYFPDITTGFLNHWTKDMTPPENKDGYPVVFVSYDDALAYAGFIGGRLPTNREWFYAAFGPANRIHGAMISMPACAT